MAVPGVSHKLEKMLKTKQMQALSKRSKIIENAAKSGNVMA